MFPLIIGAALVTGLSAVGITKGKEGIDNIGEAGRKGQCAESSFNKSKERLNKQWAQTNNLATIYGKLQLRVGTKTVKRFVDFIQRNGQKASQIEQQLLNEIAGITIEDLDEFQAFALDAEQTVKGVSQAAAAGVSAGSATVGIANAIGTVAVPQFFGLFAKQVGVAQLGLPGVALYLGAGNMLLGGAVLGGVAVAPALAIGGFNLAGKGEEALTKAKEYEVKVNRAIGQHQTAEQLLKRTEKRIRELGILIKKLENRASESLDVLEFLETRKSFSTEERKFIEKSLYSPFQRLWRAIKLRVTDIFGQFFHSQRYEENYVTEDFDLTQHASEFQKTALLIKALVEIVKTPILDQHGALTAESSDVQHKYKSVGVK